MASPISFPSTTPNTALPLLFSGQAQKEFTLNQALAILDSLIGAIVEAVRSAPPADPAEGVVYLVAASATGGWAGHSDELAARIGGDWHFVAPREGMVVFDRELGRRLFYRSQWQEAALPAIAQGGSVVDAEARAALAQLIGALQDLGLLPQS